MDELALWKTVPKLSVDEFMCLLFGIIPGNIKFDYGKKDEWPSGAEAVYQLLAKSIRNYRLKVTYDNSDHDPHNIANGYAVAYYNENNEPWWHGGKISKEALRKWLIAHNIQSGIFDTSGDSSQIPEYLNKRHDNHSFKLAAAIEAWEAFNGNPALIRPGKSLKANIEKWLTDNAERLNLIHNGSISQTAIEEIAKIVNWETKGGSPKL